MIDKETQAAVVLDPAPQNIPPEVPATAAELPPQEPVTPAVTIMPEQIQAALQDKSSEIGAMVDAFIANEVKARLAGIAPKRATADPHTIQKAQFDKMPYRERVKLFLDHPDIYNKLNGGTK